MRSLNPFVFLALGLVCVVLFQDDVYSPIWISVVVYVWISTYLLRQFRSKRIGAVILVLWLVYLLPFIHIVPYLWFDFDRESPKLLWGLAVNPYMLDEQIIKLTAMIGAVGGAGIALGVSLNTKKIVPNGSSSSEVPSGRVRVLSRSVWTIWVIVGVVLSWLAAPQETLFTAAYTDSRSLLANANFSSAWMISYLLLAFALCDAVLDRDVLRKRFKRRVIVLAIVYLVLVLQLMRGDRESMPFIFGAMLVYFYWAPSDTQRQHIRSHWIKIVWGSSIILIVSMLLGVVRTSLTEITSLDGFLDLLAFLADTGAVGFANLLHGTWSSVLLTPLSVAGDHINGLLDLKLGATYRDLFLSIPPGFIADFVGYERPFNIDTSPAREMHYGQGGTHATVVPFLNFRMIGVFLIPALWAFIITGLEKNALRKLGVINLSLLCTIVTAAPHWLWYGEKDGFNAFAIWLLLSIVYRLLLGKRKPPVLIANRA